MGTMGREKMGMPSGAGKSMRFRWGPLASVGAIRQVSEDQEGVLVEITGWVEIMKIPERRTREASK